MKSERSITYQTFIACRKFGLQKLTNFFLVSATEKKYSEDIITFHHKTAFVPHQFIIPSSRMKGGN